MGSAIMLFLKKPSYFDEANFINLNNIKHWFIKIKSLCSED